MRSSIYFLSLCVALVVAMGCDAASYDYLLVESETHTWSSQGVSVFRAGTVNGGVSVSGDSGDSIAAVVTRSCTGESKADASDFLDDIVVTDSTEGGEIILRVNMPENEKRDYSADLDVTTPAQLAIDLETANGNVSVENMSSDISVYVANGNIEVALPGNASAEFNASAENGTVEVTGFGSVIYTVDEMNQKQGTIGQGEASIILTATNGNITIRAS